MDIFSNKDCNNCNVMIWKWVWNNNLCHWLEISKNTKHNEERTSEFWSGRFRSRSTMNYRRNDQTSFSKMYFNCHWMDEIHFYTKNFGRDRKWILVAMVWRGSLEQWGQDKWRMQKRNRQLRSSLEPSGRAVSFLAPA